MYNLPEDIQYLIWKSYFSNNIVKYINPMLRLNFGIHAKKINSFN